MFFFQCIFICKGGVSCNWHLTLFDLLSLLSKLLDTSNSVDYKLFPLNVCFKKKCQKTEILVFTAYDQTLSCFRYNMLLLLLCASLTVTAARYEETMWRKRGNSATINTFFTAGKIRACLHGVGGPQVSEVTRFAWWVTRLST